ncbi:hypothetical protein [Pseudoxanthomonas putridarboris]|uniref:Uncharacterized protein n=1 Tax=Pseudoxanthomonas putridarboris TaxID=752605 RepID=A0ABU9IWZ2_9GAMM
MQSETRKQWWQQLGGISQGMLFMHGHIVSPEALEGSDGDRRREPRTRDAAGKRRHERAVQRLSARRLREMTSLSLFR